jgi:hypothetical protein
MNEKPDIQHCQWCRDVLRSEHEALEQQVVTLKKSAEYERIGRAVVEWVRANPYAKPMRMEDDSQFGYAGAVEEIKQVIAKARES